MKEARTAPRASIIIPVYNAAKTLAECLDSILNQTLTEFEIICIDDGSADNSWEILQDYAARDPRVRIVHQENRGPGMTRNHGLRLATGTYILFVDSDDYIMPNTLETVCGTDNEQDADIVLFDGDKFDAVTGKRIPIFHMLRTDLLPKDTSVFSIQSCPEKIFQISSPGPVNRAYRRELIEEHGLCFSDMPNSEDLFFSYSAIASARSIAYSTEKLYMYRVNQTTNVESGKAKAPLCFIEAFLQLAHYLMENDLFELSRKSFGLRFCGSIIHAVSTIHSESARAAIYERLCEDDVLELHVFDQDDSFYDYDHEVRQARWFMDKSHRDSIAQPKVSVIIPVYNVEKYLVECLDSLLSQTLPEFEVLCVDDGSTDSSIDILNLYSRLDSRIKVVLANHTGAAAARNKGIELAAGEYLYFMDSDDTAMPTLLEESYTAAIEANADVVAFDVQTLNMENGKRERPLYCFRMKNAPEDKPVFSVADAPNHIFQISNPSPWTKLVRRQFVLDKDLRYQNLNNTNDAYFAHMSMALAQRIALVNESLYTYRIGMTTNIQSKKEKHPECVVDAYIAIYERLRKERIWKLCEKSWLTEFLSVICFTLKTVSTREAYQKLYDRLNQPDVAATRYMDHDEAYYPEPYHFNLLKKFLSSPIKFACKDKRNTEILISASCADPIVSVIIPSYNVEDYISECLTSIQNQTLQNIEIICVDDGSSDNSRAILCEEARKDPRITVITQKNSGQSAARNAAIKVARGKYLYYMDSDDILELNALQMLVDTIEENDLDCVFFGGQTFYESEKLRHDNSGFENYYRYRACCGKPMSGPDLFTTLVRAKEYRVSPCMQLVSADLVRDNGITFYEGIVHEDNLYTLQIILHSRRCMTLSNQFYLRRVRGESIMTSEVSIGNLLGYLVCYAESLRVVDKFALSGSQYDAVTAVHEAMIYHIQKYYNTIIPEERLWIPAFCTSSQRSVYKTLIHLFEQQKSLAAASTPSVPGSSVRVSSSQNKRLNDHDTALRYAQEALEQNRDRLNDHDTALRYAQEALEQNRDRLNDHDTALGYAQEALAANRERLNDHDTALGYAQEALDINRTRLNDHDTALGYVQEAIAANKERLNDHDTALGYAQESLAANRDRLDDHDSALSYAQEALAANRDRLDDHDSALSYAQEALAANRQRLDDHDSALGYAQESLAVYRQRLDDHDSALGYAQEALASNRNRLNDHDVALGNLQNTVDELRRTIDQMQHSLFWKMGRVITWLPRKLKALVRR